MDNFFEILIYLIIIISFLSSIFKKKKQQQQRPVPKPQKEEHAQAEVTAAQTRPKEEYDILKEIEDFFKVGDVSTEQKEHYSVAQPETVTSAGETTRAESWHEETKSEHIVDEWEHKKSEVKRIVESVDSGIEKKAALFEKSLDRKVSEYTALAELIGSKFKNPTTLKEYIIFSEILGKPKALRR